MIKTESFAHVPKIRNITFEKVEVGLLFHLALQLSVINLMGIYSMLLE